VLPSEIHLQFCQIYGDNAYITKPKTGFKILL
jgi:hypothetical protein